MPLKMTKEQFAALKAPVAAVQRAKRVANSGEGTDLERAFLFYLNLFGADLPPVTREYHFCPDREWRFDFCWPALKIAVECEGYDHQRPATYAKDIEKYNTAAVMGWRLIRLTPRYLYKQPEQCIEAIRRAMAYFEEAS